MFRKDTKIVSEVKKGIGALARRTKNKIRTVLRAWLADPHPLTLESRISTRSEARENTVLLVSHAKKQCGIYQYGQNVYDVLAKSKRYAIAFVECNDEKQLDEAIRAFNPSIVFYNYFLGTMPWLNAHITRKYKVIQMGVMHEVTQEDADKADDVLFDYHLCPDPTLLENNPRVFRIPRIIPEYANTRPMPSRVRVGSFGFGIHDKGFRRLVETVQNEFDDADITILMPFNDVVDVEGRTYALRTARECREAVRKPGINLNISHQFLGKTELLDFLASNSVNAFFYDVHKHHGISSTIEHALAVQRPLAITKCGMFRHVLSASPTICIEDTTLKAIMANGVAPLAPFVAEWTEANFVTELERIFDKALGKDLGRSGGAGKPESRRFNRILDNSARLEYFATIRQLFEVAPLMMTRKIQEANVQQAFVADTVLHFTGSLPSPKVLCVGSYEDTATELLKTQGVRPEEIDPSINYDLNGFFNLPSTTKGSYDVVYSTSVIEHVEEDELFLDQICKLLKDGGIGVLTCDFKDGYSPAMEKPAGNIRLYTVADLNARLRQVLEQNQCMLVDAPSWEDVRPDFVYMGVFVYTFATFVFRKE